MHSFNFIHRSAVFRCLILFHIFILPMACSTGPHSEGTKPVSLYLPDYAPGTTYVYSNGSWETVADVSAQLVTWQDHRGNIYHRSRDFTYRSVKWDTGSRQGNRQFAVWDDFLVKNNNSLWPLHQGNESRFTEVVTSRKTGEPEKSYEVNWSCEVAGTARVAVMAGDFDTWKITCRRYNNFQNPSKAKIQETRIWYYAPEIRHYVLMERHYPAGKADRRLELLAVLPPLVSVSDLTRRQMSEAFQKALEYKKRGEVTAWSTPKTSGSGQVTPTDTFKLADGRFSRRYVQTVNYPDGPKTYYGLAVRDFNGRWIIPRR